MAKKNVQLRKPTTLSPDAAAKWDSILDNLKASRIELTPAHEDILALCSTLSADIRDCWRVLQANGSAYCKAGTGAVKLHPAAARLDVLRRDLIKALAQLGLQKPPKPLDDDDGGLEDILSGRTSAA